MNRLGISRVEKIKLVYAAYRAYVKTKRLNWPDDLETVEYLLNKLSKYTDRPLLKEYFYAQGQCFIKLRDILELNKGGHPMSIDLGITRGELLAMIPDLLAEAWSEYNDDDQITLDEAALLVALLIEKLGEAADLPEAKEFFAAQAAACVALAPVLALLEDDGE